ncbi:MAG: trypsin-like peptidase domain-containing protein, partial [Candidatus Paceibacterota bacterium]
MRNFLSNYKLIGTILLIFTIGIASGTLGYNTEQRSIYEQQLNGIVLISVEKPQTKPEEDNINGLGTGFFIQDNLIMTNYHVVKDATLIEIVAYETQNVYEAEIYAFDEYADIALLQFKNWTEFSKENNHYIFSIEKTKPKIGSEVYTFGHPYGFEWTMTKGIVSALDRIVSANPAIYIQTDSKMGKG